MSPSKPKQFDIINPALETVNSPRSAVTEASSPLFLCLLPGRRARGRGRPRLPEHGPAGGAAGQHEEQQQRRGAAAGLLHGGGAELGALRGDPVAGGGRHLLHGRVGPQLRHHGRQAVREDGAVHGGGHQVPLAAAQHAAGEGARLKCSSDGSVEVIPMESGRRQLTACRVSRNS